MNLLPCNLDAERFVLGSTLIDDSVMSALRGTVDEGDFSVEKHRRIWSAMCGVFDAGGHVDRVTVAQELQRRGALESVDGITYIVSLDDGMPAISNLGDYTRILREKSLLRDIIRATQVIQQRAWNDHEQPDVLLDQLNGILVGLKTAETTNRPISAGDLVAELGLDRIMKARCEQGLRLPWPTLDHMLCGFQPGQMIVLAAHTSRGKTSMALQFVAPACERGAVVVFTLEMEPRRLFQRMVVQRSMVDFDRWRHNALTAEDREKLLHAANWLTSKPVYFDDRARTIPAMHAAIRQVRTRQPVALVVVDYLQLITAVGRHDSRVQEVSANSRALKLAAMDFGVPSLVLSQVNRSSAKEKRQPELYDLRDCGDIENNCDVVLLIRPEDIPAGASASNYMRPVNLHVAKQREGPTGVDVKLMWLPGTQRFVEAE